MNPHPASALSQLIQQARRASRRAHAPYSNFRVGAVLEDSQGRCYIGANMENASYPLGVCAERVALMTWRFERGTEIRRIVIYTPTDVFTPPCGWCRDALLRWAPAATIYLASRGRVSEPMTAASLLPHASETS